MTLMSSISKLTTSVDQLTGEANVTKAQLDAKVAQADAEVVVAQAEQVATEAARDAAGTHATDAETHLATVKAGVTYAGIDAILAAKAVTAVDVFVYDTSLDSDGGAWRKRCQHTSWYNEPLNTATRGGRREFPAVAVIVAEADKLTIYDGDDPALPMWMVFKVGSEWLQADWYVSSVHALNGFVVTGKNGAYGALQIFDFGGDTNSQIRNGPTESSTAWKKAGVGSSIGSTDNSGGRTLVDELVNDVAMTVRPDAPIDQATGLSVPTIAVATPGGVSVIKDDGTVQDLANVNAASRVDFDGVGNVTVVRDHSMGNGMKYVSSVAPPYSGSFIEQYNSFSATQYGDLQFAVDAQHGKNSLIDHQSEGLLAVASDDGAGLIVRNLQAPNAGMVAMRNSKHTTGWMPGDIKGAFLSDTDDTDLVELDVFPGFANVNVKGVGTWADNGDGTYTYTAVEGENRPGIQVPLPEYTNWAVELTVTQTDNGLRVGLVGDVTFTYGATVGTHHFIGASDRRLSIVLENANTTAGLQFTLSALSVRRADADRSVNNNGLIVNGTVNRTPVATGSDLVAYSGFSSSNYLEQPYNPDLDFGTGDFSVMGWVRRSVAAFDTIFARGDGTAAGWGLLFDVSSTGRPRIYFSDGSALTRIAHSATGAVPLGSWAFVCATRRAGKTDVFVNGQPVATDNGVYARLTPLAAGFLRVGLRPDGSQPAAASLALLRISATAPTAEQIKRIYEDEKVLFQPGAQATLFGTSDAVEALAHDPKTNLLHVGTSAGRSTFDGFQRVANTETPVGTAISAVNGLIAEQ